MIKIIIEEHADGFIGYPLGFKRGAIVGQGDTYQEALSDTQGAIESYIEYYGRENFAEGFEYETPLVNAFVAEIGQMI